ncbi:MAG: chemotaxis protein CheW [Phycisphaerales bacterium]
MKQNNKQLQDQLNDAKLQGQDKYLIFTLDGDEYGVEILKVREIVNYVEPNAVPQTPDYVKGVIKLRDEVIPVMDIRARFDMEAVEADEHSCIIIVELVQNDRGSVAGIIVDRVSEVLDIANEDIEQAEQLGSVVNIDFILGINKTNGSVRILLDMDKVFVDTDIGELK